MPEYLAPGVYVEEVPSGIRSIEGVSSDVAAFLGAAARGPRAPRLVTSFGAFKRTYGARDLPGSHLVSAVASFFANGGTSAWIARIGGNSAAPRLADYEAGLAALEAIEGISQVAAPAAPGDVQAALVRHCEARRDRIAVLDGPPAPWGASDLERAIVGHGLRSAFAAYYVPWIEVAGPRGIGRLAIPPCGAACGIMARVDRERGVWKASANEVVTDALGLDQPIDTGLQDLLNPRGINAIRAFEGRGIRLWGARTLSDDPEWKYLNVRRTMIYLQRSIERGLQWVVFEPNGEPLWAQVRTGIDAFLMGHWRDGALLGIKPDAAWFVRVDRTTMTQNDLDNGRLIAEIGVALLRPAEFVFFRVELPTGSP